jgi:hypothetical protein
LSGALLGRCDSKDRKQLRSSSAFVTPVVLADKIRVVIELKTATTIGLAAPRTLLALANKALK